jgi:hypothetical protein
MSIYGRLGELDSASGGSKNFCVNGHPAGNCHIARSSNDDRRKESSTQYLVLDPDALAEERFSGLRFRQVSLRYEVTYVVCNSGG